MSKKHRAVLRDDPNWPVWTGAGYRYEPRYRSACGRWLPIDRFDELITCRHCLRITHRWGPQPEETP